MSFSELQFIATAIIGLLFGFLILFGIMLHAVITGAWESPW